MRLKNSFIVILIFLLISGICFGQDNAEDENWLKGYGTEGTEAYYFPPKYYSQYPFSEEELEKGKRRLSIIRQFQPQNEWEGVYYRNVETVGDSRFIWNAEGGFFRFFFYHALLKMDYGTVRETSEEIRLLSEKPLKPDEKLVVKTDERLIKVKLGVKRFLVSSQRLRDFCQLAAGLNTSSESNYYWVKVGEKVKVGELPAVPDQCRRYTRFLSIKAEIKSINKREVVQHKFDDGTVYEEEIHYTVTLNAGKKRA